MRKEVMRLGKVQKSKRSRKNKKDATYAGLKTNTAHPSHLSSKDTKAIRDHWERLYGNKEVKNDD
jgi:hypothetical protein